MTSIALALLLAAGAVDVRGATACPSADMVAGLLPSFLGQASPDPSHVAYLQLKRGPGEVADVLNVRLATSDGTEIGSRDLRPSPDCFALAETVAAILATWEEGAATVSLPAFASSGAVSPPAVPQPPKVSKPPFELGLGAAMGTQLLDPLTADMRLEVDLGRESSPWLGRFGGVRQGERRLDVQPGYVTFNHTYAFLGLGWRRVGSAWLVGVDLGPTLGWAAMSGHGYSLDKAQRSVEVGADVRLRGGRAMGRWQVWTDLLFHGWATAQDVSVRGGSDTASLPRVDLSLSIGVSCRLRP